MSVSKPSRKLSVRELAIRNGFRSGLEDRVAGEIESHGIPANYETMKIEFVQPAKVRSYTPDFVLPNNIICETKGRLIQADRAKHVLIKKQHPHLDIRFVFSNPRAKISKGSKTSYADWCVKNGFQYATGSIPESWYHEPYKPMIFGRESHENNEKEHERYDKKK